MLVDDEHDNSLIFKIGLEDPEFEVDVHSDPESALSSFKPDYYDLLILDIKMPKMNGYELYARIKENDDKVKVCFLTASVEGYREDYRESFASLSSHSSSSYDVSFLFEPITIDDLVSRFSFRRRNNCCY